MRFHALNIRRSLLGIQQFPEDLNKARLQELLHSTREVSNICLDLYHQLLKSMVTEKIRIVNVGDQETEVLLEFDFKNAK